ncbi:hypothetical protein K1719_029348 [Acacia pycnantha]|nr:hypothetical protein K1719_029348 [Acacia pycnantha]
MGTGRHVRLFDVVDDATVKMAKANSGAVNVNDTIGNNLTNRWTGRPYSWSYHEILATKRGYFFQPLKFEVKQTLILAGETVVPKLPSSKPNLIRRLKQRLITKSTEMDATLLME